MSGAEESAAKESDGGPQLTLARIQDWVLLDGDRLAVTGVVLAGILAALLTVEGAGWVPMTRLQPTYYLFSALIGGNITLITVVVSLNQLLLSRELKSPGELESQIENVIEYRRDVEDAAGRVAPVKPMGFLELLYENTRQEAQKLGGLTFGTVDDEARERIDDLVTTLTRQMDAVDDLFDESDANTFEVLSVTLTTNYADQIHEIRKIRADHGDDLSEATMACLDGLVDRLQNLDVARQYFKSLYLQDEISSLSRVLLYAGVPAEITAVVALLGLTASGGTPIVQHLQFVIPVVVTVGFLPLALLVAFVLRTATVTQRTAATLPFTTPEQEQ